MFRRSIVALAIAAAGLTGQTVDRTKEPQTPAIPNYKLPPVSESKLPNGLTVVLVEDGRLPLVTTRLNFLAGTKFDPKDVPGLSDAVASLLTEGTKTRSSQQISEETDAMGGSLGGSADPDALTIAGSTLFESLPRLLELTADVARNASFPQDEVDLYKQNAIQGLRANHADPGFLAVEKFAQVVYGSSPYAHISATEAAIAKLDPKTLTSFRDTYLVPNNATLFVIGKLPERGSLLKTINQQFGSWVQRPVPPAPKQDLPTPKRQIVLVDRPDSVQANIYAGRLAPIRTSSEFFPLMVGNVILGGGANSRMFKDIREKEGFAYDAHSEYNTRRDAASFRAVTEVRNEVVEPALKAVLAELDQMASTPVASSELSNVKNYMCGLYLLRLETQDGVANQLNSMNTLGVPKDYLETYTTHVRSVEPDQILAAAKKYFAPGQAVIVIVGDASKIGDAVKKFGDVTVTKAN
jgi:zinc protease